MCTSPGWGLPGSQESVGALDKAWLIRRLASLLPSLLALTSRAGGLQGSPARLPCSLNPAVPLGPLAGEAGHRAGQSRARGRTGSHAGAEPGLNPGCLPLTPDLSGQRQRDALQPWSARVSRGAGPSVLKGPVIGAGPRHCIKLRPWPHRPAGRQENKGTWPPHKRPGP